MDRSYQIKIQLVLAVLLFSLSGSAIAEQVKIALRANKGVERALQRWQATADYLTQQIPGYEFKLVPFTNNSALNQAVSQGEYAFILTNPASAMEHKLEYNTQPLATLLNRRQGKGYSQFGSVIFTRADRDNINALQDLKDRDFMAVDELGFGGWRVAWRELLQQDINPYADFRTLRFGGGIQQNVVYAVRDGKVDAGSVRTDMLERMASEGLISLSDFKVLGNKTTTGFPFLHSTELYPEWPISAFAEIDHNLKRSVLVALLSMRQDHEAARQGKYVGWVSPLDYDPVIDLLRELKIGPFHVSKTRGPQMINKELVIAILIALAIVASLTVIILYLIKLNRRIANTQDNLKQEINNRERAEFILSSLAQQSLDYAKGDSFFHDCLIKLSDFFNAKYAFIGLFADPEKTRIRTFAVWDGDGFAKNFEYDLEGTPCQDIINLEEELIADNAAERYPTDELLIQMGIQSYFGSPLIAPSGKMMGLVSVMDTHPMHPDETLRPILRIFANRIALEMQRKREEEELQGMAKQLTYQASHDSLTELVNRREFETRLKAACEHASKHSSQHALCYIDLDQFKVVNDTCGHPAGDELLKQLSSRLSQIVRGSDTLARLGGDEFGVLLMDCPLSRAEDIAYKLLDSVKGFRFSWGENMFEIGASIGVVPIDATANEIYTLLQAADTACYVAKERGRNRIHVYQPDDVEIASHQGEMRWVTEITQAIEQNKLVLYRQPIIRLDCEDICEHYEILIRMRRSNDELLLPGSFIAAAERYNVMYTLDKWVIENSFAFLSEHYPADKLKSHQDTLYSINLSGISLAQEELPDFIEAMAKRYQIVPEIICFEITETATISNYNLAQHFIEVMKRKGFCFSLDDFGTGLCSYAYLRSLPVDYLKIDGRFVSGLLDDPMNRAIIESIVHIARVMQIRTISEWVESEHTLEELRAIGVDYVQGYHTGVPEPVPDFQTK